MLKPFGDNLTEAERILALQKTTLFFLRYTGGLTIDRYCSILRNFPLEYLYNVLLSAYRLGIIRPWYKKGEASLMLMPGPTFDDYDSEVHDPELRELLISHAGLDKVDWESERTTFMAGAIHGFLKERCN